MSVQTVGRTVSVELTGYSDEERHALRKVALECAIWGNQYMVMETNGILCEVPAEQRKEHRRQFWSRGNDRLGGYVRNAMVKKIQAILRRSAKHLRAGRARAAMFTGDRALSVLCDPQNQGAIFTRDGEDYVLTLRIRPDRANGRQITDDDGAPLLGSPARPIVVRVNGASDRFRRDLFLRERLDAIWSAMATAKKAGPWTAGQVHIVFTPRGKILARIAYNHPIPPQPENGAAASLGPLNPGTGELWLRFDRDESGQQALNFAGTVNRLWRLKREWEARNRGLRRRIGRAKGRKRAYLRAAARVSFSSHERAEMERLSRRIARHCRGQGVRVLRIAGLGAGDLSWHDFRQRLDHKCQELGIKVVDEAGVKERRAEVGKVARRLRSARAGMAAMSEVLRGAG